MKKTLKITLKCLFIILLTYITFALISRANNYIFVKEVYAIQDTINKQREVAFEVELTAVSDRIINTNKEIAKFKSYYNVDILKPFFCKDFKNIKYVE